MTEDHETPEKFTDEEAAFLRHVRFGELPPRARREDWVALVETDAKRCEPDEEPIGRDTRYWGS
ncbi:hypothetical protein [Rugosimonospora africana]|uniref:Uncharacterized protein n=1 Tax=Rugosimonospora africana TaxID=556532 RepID=A0A8J3QRY3_9ACTN|nr:hypothetical protein [Rugosimonospora africana]GIH16395.1 hypothetical protein Raf01_45670 [Rugosimonospora africana]